MADTTRLHAQACTSAHADNTTPTATETPALLLLHAVDHADHLRATLKGLDALLQLLHGIENARGIDMQCPDLAHLLQPLRDKAMGHADALQQLTDLDRYTQAQAAHHTDPSVTHLLIDARDNTDHLRATLRGLDALLSLLHAPFNATMPDPLTHALAHLLQPSYDQAVTHTEAIQSGLQLAHIRQAASQEATTTTTTAAHTAQGPHHA